MVEKCSPTLILRRLWNADCVIFKSVPLDKKEILLTVPSDTPIMTCILHCPLFVPGGSHY
jgi:hypothetical protein